MRRRPAIRVLPSAIVLLWACAEAPAAEVVDLFHLAPGEIDTVAASAPIPDEVPSATALFSGGYGLAVDPRTRTAYVADATRHVIYRIRDGSDRVERFAGTGIAGFNGDGRPARETMLHIPAQLAVDPATGDLFVADSQNHRVRRVGSDGGDVITVAGRGVDGIPDESLPTLVPKEPDLSFANFSGDGGPAIEAELNLPVGLALDTRGNLYIADSGNHRVRVVNRQAKPILVAGVRIGPGAIRTIAGTGQKGGGGDFGPALEASFAYPKALSVAEDGGVLLVDSFNHRLRRIDGRTGTVTTVARSPLATREPRGFAAPPSIDGVVAGADGEAFFSDLFRHAIYRYDGTRSRLVAGLGVPGRSADGEIASGAALSGPGALAFLPREGLYFIETGTGRLRRVENGILETQAGAGRPDPAASEAVLVVPSSLAISPVGDLYVGDAASRSIRRIDASSSAMVSLPVEPGGLGRPAGMVFADSGTLMVADANNHVVVRIELGSGEPRLQRVAGSGAAGMAGDSGPALEAELGAPMGLAIHPQTGELYVSTVETPAIRKIDGDGFITTVAGDGTEGKGGDGGPALEARFLWPTSIAFDAAGNLFVGDYFDHRIRRISASGVVSTFAGTGERGFSGDGGPAVSARLHSPSDLTVDAHGNLYFTDTNNHRIRRIDAREPHRISTVAGTGKRGFSGDGGPALDARLDFPRGVAVGRRAVYFTDSLNGRVRAVRLQVSKEND